MKRYLKPILAIAALSITVFACSKEESELGISLQDENTLIDGFKMDTTKVVISTVYVDSLTTKNIGTTLIGEYKDNVFGKVNASLYSQVSLSNNNGVDLSSYQLDSLVLCLNFAGVFPLSVNATTVNLQVFQLTDDLNKANQYYSFSTANFNTAAALADEKVNFNPTDSITVDDIKIPPQLKIKLSDDFRDAIGKTKWNNNDEFIKAIKGIHVRVKPNSGENKIGYYNLSSAYSGLIMYYKNEDNEPKTYRYTFDTTYVRFANYTHDYSGTDLAVFQTNPKDSIYGNNKLYFEDLAGTRLKLNFPNIIEWGRGKDYAINRAILILPVDESALTEANTAPTGIVPYMVNDIGQYRVIDDYNPYYSQYIADKKEYHIYFTRYLQKMLNGTYEDWGFYLVSDREKSAANRAILKGLNSDNPPRLEVIYTKRKN